MRQEKQVPRVWYECDYCGYSLGGDHDKIPVILSWMGEEYHFHGSEYLSDDKVRKVTDIVDHTKSCIARWFLSQSHLSKVQVEGCEPESVKYLGAHRKLGGTRD